MHKPLEEYKPFEGDEVNSGIVDATSRRLRRAVAALLALGCAMGMVSMFRLHPQTSSSAETGFVSVPRSDPQKSNSIDASLIVMRHCVRGMFSGGVKAPENGVFKYTTVDAYSTKPFPVFPEGHHCLPRGADIIEAQGKFFKTHGDMPLPLRVTADTFSRNQVTMTRFMKGLQLRPEACTNSSWHELFYRPSAACKLEKPGEASMISNAQAHLRANPVPNEYPMYLQELYNIMGNGTAGNWTGLGCSIYYNGVFSYPVGACQVAAQLMEYLLMEWGGGQRIAWGRLDAEDVPKLLILHSWWFFNWWGPSDVYRYFGAALARELASKVANGTGTDLYVGHDANIMMLKGALGLQWEPAPFAANTTIPGCMLRFDRSGDIVTASYWYPATFNEVSGAMLRVPAIFSSTASSRIPISNFKHLLDVGSIASCALGGRGGSGEQGSGKGKQGSQSWKQ